MKTITISNLKGGVGKTVTTFNLAYALSQEGKRILVIDLDPQCNATTLFTELNPNKASVTDLFTGNQAVHEIIRKSSRYKDIDIISGSMDLSEDYQGYGYKSVDKAISVFKEKIDLISNNYDFCVIDTRPAFEFLTLSGLYAADYVLTPIVLDGPCFDNLSLVERKLKEKGCIKYDNWNIFVNKYNPRYRAQRVVRKKLIKETDYPILDVFVSERAAINNAFLMSKPVAIHRSNSESAQDYRDLANEVIVWGC